MKIKGDDILSIQEEVRMETYIEHRNRNNVDIKNNKQMKMKM